MILRYKLIIKPGLINKKNTTLSLGKFYHYSRLQSEIERKKRTKKVMGHKGDSDTSYSWCTWNNPQRLSEKKMEELEIRRRIETI